MGEAYQVLARKWRPQLFSELAGLEHITRTLKNAIRLNRIGHAFLFTGSRGVGKTSAARIFAKALNCKSGPAEEPCNSCENCITITAGNAADVIEIDGASNRGIDEIRLLRENVTYLPQNSPYKIYIIDEVHMLTTEAFNALLKTLEEPPAHVKFIMATTDVHKMPMTILSRCQRFDFGRLTQAVIAATLVEIGGREKLEFGTGATELLAREAQGSMRDALSLLDQARSYAGETISVVDLRQALGLIESRHCFSLLENIVCGEIGAAVSQVNDLEQAGVDLKRFSEEFLFYLRDALFLKLSSKLKNLLGISEDEITLLIPLVDDCALPYWQQLFSLWQQHHIQIKTSQTPRLALEMALVELGMAQDIQPVAELMGRIDQYLKTGPELKTISETEVRSPAKAGKPEPAKTYDKPKGERPSATVAGNRDAVKDSSAAPVSEVKPVAGPTKSKVQISTKTVTSRAGMSGGSPPPSSPSASPAPAGSSVSVRSQALLKSQNESQFGPPDMPPAPPPPDEFALSDSGYGNLLPPSGDQDVVEIPRSAGFRDVKTDHQQETASLKIEQIPEPGPPQSTESANLVAPVNLAEPVKKVISPATDQSREPGQNSGTAVNTEGWSGFVAGLSGRDARLGSMLQRSEVNLMASGTLQLAVASHALIVLDNDAAKADILSLWAKFQGSNSAATVELRPLSSVNGPKAREAQVITPDNGGSPRSLPGKEEIFNDPSVRFISERFGGRVTEIRKK